MNTIFEAIRTAIVRCMAHHSAPLLAALVVCGCSSVPTAPERRSAPPRTQTPAPSPYGEDFRQAWGHGQAEVSNYEIVNASGEKGSAIVVFAATQYSASARAEADPARERRADLLPVMKLNVLRRYPSHSDMTSVLITLADADGLPAGAASQVTFSKQSLAGQSWARMELRRDQVIARFHGFRAGELQRTLEPQHATLPADALPLVARRIGWPRLRLGQRYAVWLLSELNDTEPLEGSRATLSIPQDRQTVTVPAGSFRVHVFRCTAIDGPVRTWYVETEAPYRIIRWEIAGRESAGLVSSGRVNQDR